MTATLTRRCCNDALRGKWEDGKIIICGGCFRPYTAIVVDELDEVTGARTEVPSWWTGLVDRG